MKYIKALSEFTLLCFLKRTTLYIYKDRHFNARLLCTKVEHKRYKERKIRVHYQLSFVRLAIIADRDAAIKAQQENCQFSEKRVSFCVCQTNGASYLVLLFV